MASRQADEQAVRLEVLDRLFAFAMQFLVWWHQAGTVFYGKGPGRESKEDEGLRMMAADAVAAVGGWRRARAILRGLAARDEAEVRRRAVRGIRIRREE